MISRFFENTNLKRLRGKQKAFLTKAFLTKAFLTKAFLTKAFLTKAFLTKAFLTKAFLTKALTKAFLTKAFLTKAFLTKAFLTKAFGGPDRFEGRDLTAAHAELVQNGLGDEHFDAVAGHLAATLNELGVAEDTAEEVMAIAASTRDAVLGRAPTQTADEESTTMELKREVTEGAAGLAPAAAATELTAAEYQQMLENMPINVMMADPKTFDITYVNRTSVRPCAHLNTCCR